MTFTIPLSLDDAYRRGLARQAADDWDTKAAHVSDMSGLCDRLTWYRRSGADLEPHDDLTKTTFTLGHMAEAALLDRIDDGLPDGWTLTRQLPITVGLRNGVLAMVGYTDPHVEGHIDGVVRNNDHRAVGVVDTKSTVWWSNTVNGKQVWKPKDLTGKESNRLQVATYALALGAPAAALYELDLGSKQRLEVWFDPEEYRALATRRLREVLERTDPAKPAPAAEPNPWTIGARGLSWACGSPGKRGYCPAFQCPRHVMSQQVEDGFDG